MGTSTDAQICFGVLFEDGFEFPWDDEQWEGDVEQWWRCINNYVPPSEPYNDAYESGYAPGFSSGDPRIQEYYAAQSKWLKDNPLPIELVNYCSGDCEMYILALTHTVQTVSRGYPKPLDRGSYEPSMNDEKVLVDFCDKYGIDTGVVFYPSKWYLSSYWG